MAWVKPRITSDGDQLIVTNPCDHIELPKVIARKSRTLTPEEFDRLINALPDRHRLMVETAIETGMRWGELIALRPLHIDFLRKSLTWRRRSSKSRSSTPPPARAWSSSPTRNPTSLGPSVSAATGSTPWPNTSGRTTSDGRTAVHYKVWPCQPELAPL